MKSSALADLADEYATLALFTASALPSYIECGNHGAARNAHLRYVACSREFKHLTGTDLNQMYPHSEPAVFEDTT